MTAHDLEVVASTSFGYHRWRMSSTDVGKFVPWVQEDPTASPFTMGYGAPQWIDDHTVSYIDASQYSVVLRSHDSVYRMQSNRPVMAHTWAPNGDLAVALEESNTFSIQVAQRSDRGWVRVADAVTTVTPDSMSWRRDGKKLSVASTSHAESQVWGFNKRSLHLSSMGCARTIAWSPVSDHLLSVSSDRAVVMLDKSVVTEWLVKDGTPRCCWSSDGRYAVIAVGTDVRVISILGMDAETYYLNTNSAVTGVTCRVVTHAPTFSPVGIL